MFAASFEFLIWWEVKHSDYFLSGTPVQNSSQQVLLPGVTAVINWADAAERANFSVFASIKEEVTDLDPAFESTVEKEVKVPAATIPFEVCHHIIFMLPAWIDLWVFFFALGSVETVCITFVFKFFILEAIDKNLPLDQPSKLRGSGQEPLYLSM